jgi:tRNA(adenine34) deaminase
MKRQSHSGWKFAFASLLLCLLLFPLTASTQQQIPFPFPGLEDLEKRVDAYVPDPQYPDDKFVLVTLREGIAGRREGNGGVGACLVREGTGEIVETGHNRQYTPHFRSDMHAEMDLLNRYEDKIKGQRFENGKQQNPRRVEGLVLYTSFEPCPMCFTRIINAGIKKTLYAVADQPGGMCSRSGDMPPFWKDMGKERFCGEAACSPELKDIAFQLFGHYSRRNTKP